MSAMDEYLRGRDLYARGRPDLAQARWDRAAKQGYDVDGALKEQGLPTAQERTRINGRRGDDDAERQKVLQALRDAQPEHIRNPKTIGVPESLRQPVVDRPMDLKPTVRVVDEAEVGGVGSGDSGGGGGGSLPTPPTTGEYVLGTNDGAWTFIEIDDCEVT
jgi:hypothetical protein